MLIFMAITYFIVGLGVNNGLEKANFIMMPALIVVAAILAVYALTMPGAIDGLAFYLVPDFSKFSPELVIAALGQTFFTLSLAMGIMVTLSFIEPLGAGTSILDFLDFISNSVMMPIVALLTCIFIGWIVGPKMIEEEVMLSSRFRLRKVWVFMIKYLAPVALVVILVAYVAQTFGFFSM